jgi:Lhr-like helicase
MFTHPASPSLTQPQLYAALPRELTAWFRKRFGDFSPAQPITVPEIAAARSTLLSSPTALVTIDDYGFVLTVRPFQEMSVAEWRPLFRRAGAGEALRSALADAQLVKWQFRGVAQTGLMVPRRVPGAERGSCSLQRRSEIPP